jgi:hypothetical protein
LSIAPLATVYRLTLLVVLLYKDSPSAITAVVRAACVVGLTFPQLLQQARWWWIAAGCLAVGDVQEWRLIDNHQFLITYCVIICALSVSLRWPIERFGASAGCVIGLVFLFATAWKIGTGQYADGEFMYWTFLTDTRVDRLSSVIAGVASETIAASRSAIGHLASTGDVSIQLPVLANAALWRVATIASWLTIAGEGAVALSWLVPTGRLYLVRHILLLGFCGVTYFILPVPGFAFVLLVFGLASVDPEDRELRIAYIVILALTQLVLIPWQSLLPLLTAGR